MLEIQKFIYNHIDNWEQLLVAPPYNLIIRKDNGFILFKYSTLKSNFNEQIVIEARGIILDEKTFDIVAYSFPKFWNIDEKPSLINWENSIATEKIDGTMIRVWCGHGKWYVSTMNNIDANNAPIDGGKGYYKNFYDLFMAAARNCNFNIENLVPGYCYTFELVSKYNTIVLPYDEPTLYHISTRDMLTLQEIEIDIGIQKPREYRCNNEQDFRELVEKMDKTHEGIVVHDMQYNRVKIKTSSYFLMHHLAHNGKIKTSYALDLIMKNDYDEFLSYFPYYKKAFNELIEQINIWKSILFAIDSETKQLLSIHPDMNRKDYANAIKNCDKKAWRFLAYDNKLLSSWDKYWGDSKKFLHFISVQDDVLEKGD